MRHRATTSVVLQFDKGSEPDARYGIVKSATQRAARPDPSRRKRGLLGMTIQTAPPPAFRNLALGNQPFKVSVEERAESCIKAWQKKPGLSRKSGKRRTRESGVFTSNWQQLTSTSSAGSLAGSCRRSACRGHRFLLAFHLRKTLL